MMAAPAPAITGTSTVPAGQQVRPGDLGVDDAFHGPGGGGRQERAQAAESARSA
jgi:hypothetical protein